MTSRKALLAVTLAAVVVLDVSEATRAESEEAEFIELMGGYLDVSEQFLQFASSSEAAEYFAIEGIIEIYEERGEMRAAIPHLQQILECHDDNLTVRDLYNETGQQELALRELEAIIDENR